MSTEYPALRAYLLSLGRNYRERASKLTEITGTEVSPRVVADLTRGIFSHQVRAILDPALLTALAHDVMRKSR